MTTTIEENPLVEGLERLPVPPTTLVIFGATGDLAHRKLLPALYNLAHEGALPERFELIGVARREKGDQEFRDEARASILAVLAPRARRRRCSTGCSSTSSTSRRTSTTPRATRRSPRRSTKLDEDAGQPLNRVYYLSTAPEFFPVIVEQLKAAGLHRHEQADVRVIIEKPFGVDLESARELQQRRLRACSASARSSASTTTWARRPSRT